MDNNQITYYDKLSSVETDWELLYDKSSLPYFCSFQWHKVVLSFLKKATLTKQLLKLQYFSVQNANSQIIVIGFFFINRYGAKKRIQFSHMLGPSDYYDFVYKDNVIASDVKEIIDTIQKEYNAKRVSISMVKESSIITNYLVHEQTIQKTILPCVAIELLASYDNYLQSLSKSVKQNIRTAYNRLKRDDFDFKLSVFNNKDTRQIDFQKLKNLYALRNSGRKEKLHWKTKIVQLLNNAFSGEVDMFDLRELKQTDFTLGVIEFNNEIAAYFFGFKRNGKIEINRVVINEKFKFYSPGMILFNEYIKTAIEKDLKVIDLTNGDEKYKFDLGGKIHNVYNATVL